MALINVAKTALRLTTNALDDELADEIDACLLRLPPAPASCGRGGGRRRPAGQRRRPRLRPLAA